MPIKWIRASVSYLRGRKDSCFVGRSMPGLVQTEFTKLDVEGEVGRGQSLLRGREWPGIWNSNFIRPQQIPESCTFYYSNVKLVYNSNTNFLTTESTYGKNSPI